jgi:hypothetical protein
MPRNRAIEAILAAEGSGDLWSRDVFGYPVWSLERFRRYRHEALAGDPEARAASTQPTGRQRLETELRTLRASLHDLRRGAPPDRGRDVWLLSSSSYRRRTEAGDAPCIFATHLARHFGDRLLHVELNTARLPSLDRDDVCFIDALQIPALTAARGVSGLLGRFVDETTAAAFAPSPRRRLADRALYGRLMLEAGRRWMDRSPPSAVFVLCGYNMHTPLQLAAAERGIPVIELQHGIVHESHAGYVYDDLPRRTLPVPDHLVLFGSYFGRVLEREAPRWAGRWTVGGHPWLKSRSAEPAVARSRRTVLIFSQYELPVRIQVRDVAAELRRRLPDDWDVVIKPHPRESDAAGFYAPSVDAGCALAPHGADSYAMLAGCELAVSVYSTLAIEALAFPCRSAVLPSDKWTESISELVEAGILEHARDGAELAELAQRDVAVAERGSVARDLFGIGLPDPDFDAVVAQAKECKR